MKKPQQPVGRDSIQTLWILILIEIWREREREITDEDIQQNFVDCENKHIIVKLIVILCSSSDGFIETNVASSKSNKIHADLLLQ